MLSTRRRIKKTNRQYSLRKKLSGLKKISNDKKNCLGAEEVKQKNNRLNVITLFPNKA